MLEAMRTQVGVNYWFDCKGLFAQASHDLRSWSPKRKTGKDKL